MRRRGLRLVEPDRDVTVHPPVAATVPPDTDLVLLAVKSHHTADALAQIPAGCTVVSLQNGLSNEPRIAAAGHPTVGAMVYVPAVHLEPGAVHLHGTPIPGRIDLGDWPSGAGPTATALSAALHAAGFWSDPREDIMEWKRTKLLTNLAGGLEAACGHVPQPLWQRLVDEAHTIYRAAGLSVLPIDTLLAACPVRLAPVAGANRPGGSMWQSVARGIETEADEIYGELVRIAARAGIDAPRCRAMLRVCAELATPGGWTVADLERALEIVAGASAP